jgi:uncharacterized protein YndB with AHSA1/START domain
MNSQTEYSPGHATGAQIDTSGDTWALVMLRDLHHRPEDVWAALTEPAQLREWAPFDADRDLGAVGPATLHTIGTPQVDQTQVTRAEAPALLEYRWGGNALRWELERRDDGTRLRLWHAIDRRYIAMGAAGWHLCLDVLAHLLDGQPIGRRVGPQLMGDPGWQRLHAEYAQQFGAQDAE